MLDLRGRPGFADRQQAHRPGLPLAPPFGRGDAIEQLAEL
jgi:hypothetical protein